MVGGLPALLSALAEFQNPVSDGSVRQSTATIAEQLSKETNPAERQKDVSNIVGAVTHTEIGAVEVSAILPTWIAVTAGFATVALEISSPCSVGLGVAVWALLSVVMAPRLLGGIDYHKLATGHPGRFGLGAGTNAETLSRGLILCNVAVMTFVLWVAYEKAGNEADGRPCASPIAPSSAITDRTIPAGAPPAVRLGPDFENGSFPSISGQRRNEEEAGKFPSLDERSR